MKVRVINKMNSKLEENKGVTLIALVVSIVVLLILAGVSIAMLIGENGIITQAQRAKEITERNNEVEELELALTTSQIEAKTKNNSSIKEFLEDENRSGIKDVKVLEENVNAEIELLGTINDKVWLQKKNGEIILGKNLIKNGLLEFGNNTNFLQMDYKSGYLSIYTPSVYMEKYSDELIEVDTNKKYLEIVNLKTSNVNTQYYIGFAEYDIDKLLISPRHVMYVENSLTTLAKDLDNGDTVVYLDDVSGFRCTQTTPYYQKGFIFWNYKDSTRISISRVNIFKE